MKFALKKCQGGNILVVNGLHFKIYLKGLINSLSSEFYCIDKLIRLVNWEMNPI